MRPQRIGEVTVSSIVEREGPWRSPEAMFPEGDKATALAHLATMEPFLYDAESDRLVLTYQSYVVRTRHHTVLIDTCTGEDKGHPPPMDFPKRPWLDAFHAEGTSTTAAGIRDSSTAGGYPRSPTRATCSVAGSTRTGRPRLRRGMTHQQMFGR